MDINPYASPQTHSGVPLEAELVESSAWRNGNLLIVGHNAVLPPRCVKCNAPTDRPHKRFRMTWYSPLAYLGLLLGLVPFVLIVLLIQRKLVLDVGICEEHRHRRRLGIVVGLLGSAMGFGLIVLGLVQFTESMALPFCSGLALIGVSLVFCIRMTRIVWPKHIDKRFAEVHGVCPEFLDALPEAPS